MYDRVPFESATAIHPGTELEIIKPSLLPAVPALHLMHEFAHVLSDDDSSEQISGLLPSVVAVLAEMDLEDDDVEGRVCGSLIKAVSLSGGVNLMTIACRLHQSIVHLCNSAVSEAEDGDLRCHAQAVERLDIPIYRTFGVRNGDAFLDQLLQSLREDESDLPIKDAYLHLPRFGDASFNFRDPKIDP